jgi:lipopolysaccharide export LptBFGC system permease protein LptF
MRILKPALILAGATAALMVGVTAWPVAGALWANRRRAR